MLCFVLFWFLTTTSVKFQLWNDWRMICSSDWLCVCLNHWRMVAQRRIQVQTGGSRSEPKPKNDSVRRHFMLRKSHKFPETKVTYAPDEPTEREMWSGKKRGTKVSRWHGQMFPGELTHDFPFTFYSSHCNKSRWQACVKFYKDFLGNENFI